LVDLHSLPLWNWLRPYAANGAPPLPRSAVAIRASKDDALLVQLLQLAKDMATISISGYNASRVLSFVGATVSEALARQATTTTTTSGVNNQSGTRMVSEQTVRHILPYLLSACGGEPDETSTKHPSQGHQLFLRCPEWRNLGFILTTVLSDHCILGYAAREVIAVTMAKGSLLLDAALRQDDDYDEEEALEAATDSLLAISAFLIPNSTSAFFSGHIEHDNFVGIHLLNTSASHHKVSKKKKNTTKHTNNDTTTIIGCELPKSTYLALCRHPLLARAFSNAVEGRNIDITSFIAAFIKRAISYLPDEKDGKRLGSQIIELLVSLI